MKKIYLILSLVLFGLLGHSQNEEYYLSSWYKIYSDTTDAFLYQYHDDMTLDKIFQYREDTITDPDREYRVMETLGNYPTLIHVYYGVIHNRTHAFNYITITDIVKRPEEPAEAFSISYFNLMGQQIQKPKKGFYIERKVTQEGIISTKHYLQ